jgi:hypothetical protein
MNHRERLLARIGNINDFSRPRPLVTLEEFFEGNNDPGSIGYNLSMPPTPAEFYALLKTIRTRPAVRDVRIQVMDLQDPDEWPSTDLIWIITSATPQEVRTWFPKNAAPDEMIDGFAASMTPVEHTQFRMACVQSGRGTISDHYAALLSPIGSVTASPLLSRLPIT